MNFATLTIQRNLSRRHKDDLYWRLYEAYKKDEPYDFILRSEGIDPTLFGSIFFFENRYGIFAEHVPGNRDEKGKIQLQCEMNIASEWLMGFSFTEMNVIGLDMGVFEAFALVSDVIDRLQWAEVSNAHYDLFLKRSDLLKWIKYCAHPEDQIHLCSQWIFYHEEGKYNYDFVRQHINKRIIELRKMVTCNHWSKHAIVKPEQVQMTA